MTATATFEKKEKALHLLPGSTLPQPLRGFLEQSPIPLDSELYVAQCAWFDKEMYVELDNHDQVPGAVEAGFQWAHFVPTYDTETGELSGVRATYE